MLHGANDTTVSPSQSELLKSVLDANSVPNERYLYPGYGHNLHIDNATEVYTRINDWFTRQELFTPSAPKVNPKTGKGTGKGVNLIPLRIVGN